MRYALSYAPEIVFDTVERAKSGDRFEKRMYYEHILSIAKEPEYEGLRFGSELSKLPEEQITAFVAFARKTVGPNGSGG